jgi:hypothetical protein
MASVSGSFFHEEESSLDDTSILKEEEHHGRWMKRKCPDENHAPRPAERFG